MVLVGVPLDKTFPKAILFFDYHSFGKLRRSSNSGKTHYRFFSQEWYGGCRVRVEGAILVAGQQKCCKNDHLNNDKNQLPKSA